MTLLQKEHDQAFRNTPTPWSYLPIPKSVVSRRDKCDDGARPNQASLALLAVSLSPGPAQLIETSAGSPQGGEGAKQRMRILSAKWHGAMEPQTGGKNLKVLIGVEDETRRVLTKNT
ncbi:Uncharacterized protein HZ326_26111 [Fusarium oxysporum f. sp. albedinis]|nr:Uncharacterized protein HZ326_26111 [Fusarium oxysporum f. sp. albedinis]